MKYTVGIIDDHLMFRKGLMEIINLMSGYEVVLDTGNGEDLLKMLDYIQPNILILDLKMPKLDGFDAVEIIAKKFPGIKIIVLSMYDQENFVLHAFQLGVHGYLLKNSDPSELQLALEKVIGDGFYFTDRVSKVLAKGLRKKSLKPELSDLNISVREMDILKLICEGFTDEEISKQIFLSKRTVEAYRQNLVDKAGVNNTASLVSWAFRNNLVE